MSDGVAEGRDRTDAGVAAATGAVPAVPPKRFDPARIARIVRRVTPFLAAGLCLLLYLHFGWLRVPQGMDTTLPAAPPGSLCIIRKNPGAVPVGSLVFANVPTGGMVLSRVVARSDEGVYLQHDTPGSRLPSSDHFGAVPVSEIHALVLTVLLPDHETPETRDPRDKIR